MPIRPDTIDIVVADMGKALAFHRALGPDAPAEDGDEPQVQIVTRGGATIGLVTEALVRANDPRRATPTGQRVTFACRCDSAAEVDETFARVTAAGHAGLRAPWDAVRGQRYAFLQDPVGNRVDLFAPLAGEA